MALRRAVLRYHARRSFTMSRSSAGATAPRLDCCEPSQRPGLAGRDDRRTEVCQESRVGESSMLTARCNTSVQAIGDPGRVVVGRVDEAQRFMLVFPELPGD